MIARCRHHVSYVNEHKLAVFDGGDKECIEICYGDTVARMHFNTINFYEAGCRHKIS